MALNRIVYKISSLVCHQHPERCLEIGGRLLPLCARCTGIYAGFLLAFLAVWIYSARNRFPGCEKQVCLLAGFILLAFIAEGFLSWKNLACAGNNLRFLSGLYGGASLGILVFHLLNSLLTKKNYFTKTKFTLKNFFCLLAFLFSFFVFAAYSGIPPTFYLLLVFSFGGLLFAYAAVNLAVVLAFTGNLTHKTSRIKIAGYILVLASVEFLILHLFRS